MFHITVKRLKHTKKIKIPLFCISFIPFACPTNTTHIYISIGDICFLRKAHPKLAFSTQYTHDSIACLKIVLCCTRSNLLLI